jgi:hypothetical protein
VPPLLLYDLLGGAVWISLNFEVTSYFSKPSHMSAHCFQEAVHFDQQLERII